MVGARRRERRSERPTGSRSVVGLRLGTVPATVASLDGQLVGEQEKPIDWSKILREMRAAGVRSSGDDLDEHDLEAPWTRAEGPYAPLALPATVVPLAERLAAKRPDETDERQLAEEESGQLAFELAA